jgi:hypothetical protein
VSEDFENALSNALDHAARAATPIGPGAARIRGGNRTMRKQFSLAAVSLVLVAVGTTVAFKATSSNGGGTQHLTGATAPTTTSASVSASPTTVPTQTTASDSPSGSTAPSSPATSTTTSATQSVTADPHHVDPAAWLSASEMPLADNFTWNSLPSSSVGGQALTSTVSYVPNNAGYQALTFCGDPAKFVPHTTGAQLDGFQAGATSGGYEASEYIFFYANAAAAQQGYAWLQSTYTTGCTDLTSAGAQVTQVASDGTSGMAWLSRKGTAGFPDMPIYQREYFVLRGDTIAYVQMTSPRDLSTTYDDSSELSTIASHLCVYGGSCS